MPMCGACAHPPSSQGRFGCTRRVRVRERERESYMRASRATRRPRAHGAPAQVWEDKIVDNVFFNAAHFGVSTRTASLPPRVLAFLDAQPRNVPFGANRGLIAGRVPGAPYAVAEPLTQG
eukprot:3668970-Prymnesium_polylepis.1